jgi:FRG domain
MSQVQSTIKHNGLSAIEISDLQTLEHAIQETLERFDLPLYPLWRGHAEMNWVLTPEAFRPNIHGRYYDELTLIREFMAHAESRSARCPDEKDHLGWMIFARHYRLPTRLLDWSMSPLLPFILLSRLVQRMTDACGPYSLQS